ncbi:hypothetical protein L1987_65914 [Smallanthus sonchifolius]|uniref:Uncharacterized protein n=1 Tax=Smallanthus sonchifolius TaxID=185202 RepID=A0ACB9BVV4_9ASTR|nr:hypothetical protein L1987_65914 [Smallanthus sonchifolius]
MKFGKEFATQTVPEWREAYMNYNYLKTLLDEILIFRQRQTISHVNSKPRQTSSHVNSKPPQSLKRKASLFRAFSGLTTNSSPGIYKEDEVIIVNKMQKADEEQGGECRSYQTVFLRSSEEGGDLELVFFRGLDHEFNKVIHFYKTKMEEVVKEAEELNIQMDALIALRIKVNNPMQVIQESKISEEHQDRKKLEDVDEYKMASLDVLNRVKINATTETPVSTVRSVFNSLNMNLNYNKNELKEVQGKLKQAFLEFHQKLRFLKNYA